MGAVIVAIRWLGLDWRRWKVMSAARLWSGASVVLAASAILAWNRFGGLVFDGSRAFVRMTLVGVYGWIGLGTAIWLLGRRLQPTSTSSGKDRSLLAVLAAVGLAHRPLVVVGLVMFVAAGVFQVLGPGAVVALFASAFWFPAGLARAAQGVLGLQPVRAVVAVVVPYIVWTATVGSYLYGQVEHLL